GALSALGPMGAVEGFDPMLAAIGFHRRDLGIGIADEMVYCDGDRHAELLHVLDMPAEICEALLQRLDILLLEIVLADPAMHLEGADGRDDDGDRGSEPRLAALDIEEFFCPEIGAETRFGHHIIGKLERRPGRHHRIAAMSDVGKWSAMDESR